MLKKGGYDIGRKAIYYMIVSLILFFLLIYVSNAIGSYQKKDFEALDKLGYLSEIKQIKNCFAYEDGYKTYEDIDLGKFRGDILSSCYNKPARVTLSEENKELSFKSKINEIKLVSQPDYNGVYYSSVSYVIVRKNGEVFPAILKVEVGIDEV